MNNFEDKYKLYEKIEKLVEVKLNDYEFSKYGYILEKRVIAWGDTPYFTVDDKGFYIDSISYKCDFSDLLELNEEEIADKITHRIVSNINELIEKQIEFCGLTTSLQNFKRIVKLVLEGAYICADDKLVYNMGIGTILV